MAMAQNASSTRRSPWAMLTMRMTPNINAMPSAYSAYSPPNSKPCRMASSKGMMSSEEGDGECGAVECFGWPRQGDAALQQAIQASRAALRERHVLLHEHQGGAFGGDGRQRGVDLANDSGRQPQRQLVAQEQPRVAQQCAADRNHLLLPTGQRFDRQAPLDVN